MPEFPINLDVDTIVSSSRRVLGGNIHVPKTYSSREKYAAACESLPSFTSFEKLRKLFSVPPKEYSSYDTNKNLISTFYLEGTAVLRALTRPEFWLLFIFHVVISIVYYKVDGHAAKSGVALAKNWPRAKITLVSFLGSLLTFGLVFYLNNTFKRHQKQFLHCVRAGTILVELVGYFRMSFFDGAFKGATELRLHLTQLLNASYILAFAGLPQYREIGIHFWVEEYILEHKLLTQAQLENVLRDNDNWSDGRLAYKKVTSWVIEDIWNQVQKGNIRDKLGTRFTGLLFDFMKNLDMLYSYTLGPMPYAYYHHLHITLLAYLFLLGYTLTFQTPYYTIISYFIILLAFLSLRELGDMLADPFGDDALDIPVFDLANNVRWESFQLVNDFLFKGSMPGYLHLTSEEFSESLKELSDSNAGKVA